MWQSVDPILGDYLNGERGMGGVYNSLNLSLYAYAHLSPSQYLDPDGNEGAGNPYTHPERMHSTIAVGKTLADIEADRNHPLNQVPQAFINPEQIADDTVDAAKEAASNVQKGEYGAAAVGALEYATKSRKLKRLEELVPNGIETKNGVKIEGFTKHGADRAIGDGNGRTGVSPQGILDALKNPLKIGDVKTDKLGRQSQRFIGQTGEVVVNPQSGLIVSVNPTSTKKAERLMRQLENSQ